MISPSRSKYSIDDLTTFLNGVETGQSHVNRMKPATARQYKSVWHKLSSYLTEEQKTDLRKIPTDNFELILSLVDDAFQDVSDATKHSYAQGIVRCVKLIGSPDQTTDSGIYSAAQGEEPLATDPREASYEGENQQLKREIHRLHQENLRLKRALASLVTDS